MNNSVCPTDEVITFLKKSLSSNKPEALPSTLKQHIETCNECRELIENPILGKVFLQANKFSSQVADIDNNAIEVSGIKSKQIKPGQIWKFHYGINDKKFALATSEIFRKNEKHSYSLRIIPLYLNPNPYDYSGKYDYILKSEDSPLKLNSLVEWWNERPILFSQLEKKYGEVSKEVLEQIFFHVSKDFSDIELTENQKLFRATEIEIGKLYSESVFEEITSLEKAQNSSKNEFELISIDLSAMQPANEEIIIAATDQDTGYNSFQKLFEIISDKFIDMKAETFEIIKESDSAFKIYTNSNDKFSLNIYDDSGEKIRSFSSGDSDFVLITQNDCKNLPKVTKAKIVMDT